MFALRRIVPLSLLVLFGWMALSVSPRVGVTFDETAHLTAGYSYWLNDTYLLQPENGNFPQRWAALPLLFASTHFPALEEPANQNADVWWLGRELFFRSGRDTAGLLLAGRSMIVLLGIALMAVIYGWSRTLFGPTGGLISLGAAVFSPTLLAHSGLITSDVAAALGFMLVLLTWWRLSHRVTIGRIVAAGASLGLLALAKYSAALFVPIAALILLVRLLNPAVLPWQWRQRSGLKLGSSRIWLLLAAGAASVFLSVAMIWSAYGFRYAASEQAPTKFTRPWSVMLMESPATTPYWSINDQSSADPPKFTAGPVQHFVGWARDHRLLPEAYLYGLAFTDYHARSRLAYFAGEYRTTGWWEFFPVAFTLKSTLPFLGLLLAASIAFALLPVNQRARQGYQLTPLIGFICIYGLFAITSHLNIGQRHLLPIYPVLFVLIGAVGTLFERKRRSLWLGVVLGLLSWHAIESWRVRPHYLTYFNELAGGPDNGHRYFVDSSLDWGQGLPDLKAWLESNRGDEQVYLSYFGSDEPERFELNAVRIGDVYFDHTRRLTLPPLTGGLYCISATMLHRVYTEVRGPWNADYEKTYRQLADELTDTPASPEKLHTFAQLRFGRLCHFLEQRQPDAIAAHSVFIYRLSDDEVSIALNAPWQSDVNRR
jgi:4-amino-4-deoxy-L-arabinose transferase-like glycosyltransferase